MTEQRQPNRTIHTKVCEHCRNAFGTTKPKQRFCGRACAAAGYPTGRKSRGVAPRSHPDGYRRVWLPGHPLAAQDGYVLEHRLVLYKAGVDIPEGHHVHHKNGIKDDNHPENLEVLAESEHHREHIRAAGAVVNQYGSWSLDRERPHGRRNTYARGCRCEPCRQAERAYQRIYRERQQR